MSPINLTLLIALAASLLSLLALRRSSASARRDLRSLLATTSELRHLADHDALTGLPNRRRFEQELARHLAQVRRYGPEGAVLVLDLDCFKPVNDTFGHAAGDRLLARVARASRSGCARPTSSPASAATSSRSCCRGSTRPARAPWRAASWRRCAPRRSPQMPAA